MNAGSAPAWDVAKATHCTNLRLAFRPSEGYRGWKLRILA